MSKLFYHTAFLFLFFLSPILSAQGKIWYVADLKGDESGTSWANSVSNLQDIIDKAQPGDEIRVQRGVRGGGSGDPAIPERERSLVLKDGIRIIGGYLGVDDNELPSPKDHPTVLKGSFGTPADQKNIYRVVTIAASNVHLENFIIMNGKADAGNSTYDKGAGIYIAPTSTGKIVLKNITFYSNSSIQQGAAIYASLTHNNQLLIENSMFFENKSNTKGGAISVTATGGSVVELNQNIFATNQAHQQGGAIHLEGDGVFTLQGNTITANESLAGSGIYANCPTQLNLYNNIVWNNSGSNNDVYNATASTLASKNNLLGAVSGFSPDGSDQLGKDPQFVDVSLLDFRIMASSPALNKGSANFIPPHISTDFGGKKRKVGTVDIGAFECQYPDISSIIYVKKGLNTGLQDGSSWANAFDELSEALFAAETNRNIKEVRVAKGMYLPLYKFSDWEVQQTSQTVFNKLYPTIYRARSFVVRHSLHLRGGYAGIAEDESPNEKLNPTILNGDLKGNDIPYDYLKNRSDNTLILCYVYINEPNSDVLIDGFTIEGSSSLAQQDNPSMDNPFITKAGIDDVYQPYGNSYSMRIYLDENSSGTKTAISQVQFIRNALGGIYTLSKGKSNTILIHDNIIRNDGAGLESNISNTGAIHIYNNLIAHNWGGNILLEGTVESEAHITGNTTACNYLNAGVAIDVRSKGITYICNNICSNFFGTELADRSGWDGGTPGTLIVKNNLMRNPGSYQFDASNIVNKEPQFISQLTNYFDFLDANPSFEGNYRLKSTSPAIDKGDNHFIPTNLVSDLDGNARIVGTSVDIGAYEYQPPIENDVRIESVKVNTLLATASETNYTATVEYSQKPWKIEVVLTDAVNSTFKIYKGAETVAIDINNVALTIGDTDFRIVVTPKTGSSKTYNLKVTMTKKPLIITGLTIKDKEHDGTKTGAIDNKGTLNGIVNSDVVSVDYSAAVVEFASSDIGTGIAVNVSGLTLTGANAGNYTLTMPTGLTGTIASAEAGLKEVKVNTLSATASETNYTATVEYSQKPWKIEVVLTDAVISTFKIYKGAETVAIDINNVALTIGDTDFRIVVTPKTGSSKTYNLKVTMTKKPLTITGMTIKDKEQDDTKTGTIDNKGTLNGIVNSDVVSVDYSAAVVQFASSDIGIGIAVSVSGLTLTGANAGNYTLTMPTELTGTIVGSDASLEGIKINGNLHDISQVYDMQCDGQNQILVEVLTKAGATVSSSEVTITNKSFDMLTNKPMYKEVNFTITAPNGTAKSYTLKIEKRFPFDDIVFTQWNNTFMLNLKKLKDDNYSVSEYQWYKSNAAIANATKSYYSAGASRSDLLTDGARYMVALKMKDGSIIHSCEKVFVKKMMTVKAYPNPVAANQTITVVADIDQELLEGGHIEVYNLGGTRISQTKVHDRLTEIPNPQASGTYIVKFVGKDGFSETLKVIVK